MAKKETGVSTVVSESAMAELKDSYPQEQGFNRVQLPRLGMYSQDQTEGKGKLMKVIAEAGTFYTELESDEENDKGKKVWEKEEIGDEIEAIILFERRQLKFFDGEKYTNSTVYDTDDEIIPLFRDRVEVDRGTPAELKAKEEYQGVSAKGKDISKLEDHKILYVLYKDTVYQMNLRGMSMYAFKTYRRKVVPNTVITRMNSEAKDNGAIEWNQMIFEVVRPINSKEADIVIKHLRDIKKGIEDEKAFYASQKTLTKEELAEAKRRRDKEEDF